MARYLALFLLLFLSTSTFSIGTQAGTNIITQPAELQHDNRTEYSNQVSVTVSQDHGLELSSLEVSADLKAGETCYFPCTLINVGNGSDLFSFELSATTDRWTSTLLKDDNRNGLHEADETTPVAQDTPLAEDASFDFFVALTAPRSARQDEIGSTRLTVSGTKNDGGRYLGANGSFYGGPDSAEQSVSARVAYSDETAPTISDLKINGRPRFPEDIISFKPVISAVVLDDNPGNLAKIEVWFNQALHYRGTPEDWKGHYHPASGKLDLELGPLGPDTYSLKIVAVDLSGNQVTYNLGPLYVRSDSAIIGLPVNYPNPFRPLKGEITNLAYTLTRDMDLTIYIHDLRGRVILKRLHPAFEEGGKAGYNEVSWNGISVIDGVMGNGIYIVKLVHNNKVIGTAKITILDTK